MTQNLRRDANLRLSGRRRRLLPAAFCGFLLANGLGWIRPPEPSEQPPVAKAPDARVRFELPSLLWREAKASDGRLMAWDPKAITELGATMVCVIYRPRKVDEPGFRRSAVVPPKLLAETLKTVKPEVEESHRHGIKVIGFGNTILFHPEMLEAEGISAEGLHAIDGNGDRVTNNIWEKRGVYVSCLKNPHWVALQTQVALTTARAGLDGIQFDLNPYAINPGYHCQCLHCVRGWREFSRKRFGVEQPLPGNPATGLLDFTNPVDRAHREWRWQVFVDFVKAVEAAVHRAFPGFVVIMNRSSGNPDFMYQAAHGALDLPSSELHRVRLGDESSLYLYRMAEGANGGRLIGLSNSSAQITPSYRYAVALAEAYAGGGSFYATASGYSASSGNEFFAMGKEFHAFLRKNQAWFEGTTSDTSVGLLYSWRQHAFLEDPDKSPTAAQARGTDNYGRTASLLSRLNASYDCLVVEKALSASQLARYRVIVAPALGLVDERDAALLEAYVRGGGTLFSIGDLGTLKQVRNEYVRRDRSLLTAWTGCSTGHAWQVNLGSGKVAYAHVPNLTAGEGTLELSPEFRKGVEFTGLDSQVRVRSGSPVETVIRKNGGRRSIHVIRFGPVGMVVDRSVQLDYQISAGYTVKSVASSRPGSAESSDAPVSWKEASGRLTMELDRVDNYELVKVELRKN